MSQLIIFVFSHHASLSMTTVSSDAWPMWKPMMDKYKTLTLGSHRDLIAELLLESSLGNIDWYQTTWEDLRKPLYSALAAMLYTFDQVFSLYCPRNFSSQFWQFNT